MPQRAYAALCSHLSAGGQHINLDGSIPHPLQSVIVLDTPEAVQAFGKRQVRTVLCTTPRPRPSCPTCRSAPCSAASISACTSAVSWDAIIEEGRIEAAGTFGTTG